MACLAYPQIVAYIRRDKFWKNFSEAIVIMACLQNVEVAYLAYPQIVESIRRNQILKIFVESIVIIECLQPEKTPST